jgi:glycosyltransferase involved in cell wall biosynthesis
LKVVHINKTDSGGGAAVAANRLNQALSKHGVDSWLLVQDGKSQEKNIRLAGEGFLYRQKALSRFVWERIRFLPHEKNAMLRFAFSPGNTGMDLSKHPLIQEADILHLHWINQGYISLDGLRQLFSLGKPIVWTLHDMWPFTGGCHYAGTCLEFLERCSFCPFLKKPDKRDLSARQFIRKKQIYKTTKMHAVACSKWLKTISFESSLLRDKLVSNIPNPIDTALFKPLDKKSCRAKLNLPQDKKLLLFGAANVGDTRKGIRYLYEALNILVESFPVFKENVEVVVFGKIPSKVKNIFPFVTHNLKFITDTQTLVEAYNAADVYVLPSLQDNLPNTVMESMSCGTPVVGFHIGGVPEMIDHNKSGFLAEVKNSLSLATGIYETLFLSNLEEMGLMARRKVETNFSEEVVASQYKKVYEDLLTER